MDAEEFDRRRIAIEARANLRYGALLNRRSGNGGRYWALGAAIAALALDPQRREIDAEMRRELNELEAEYYRSLT